MRSAYSLLCALVGGIGGLAGVVFLASFFQSQAPGAVAAGPLPVGPNGAYFLAFTGSCLMAWSACLLGAARHPTAAPWIATATSFGLVLNAVYRMAAWLVGDYHSLGNLPRIEAGIFLALALAFLWLRPTRTVAEA